MPKSWEAINMKINQIIYVLEVAKHKNFSKAADSLFVSQPAISSQIKALEKELNIEIFQRDTHQVILTPIGEVFCEHGKAIVNEVKLLQDSINNYAISKTPIFTIGVFPFYESSILKESLIDFFHEHNKIICNAEIMETYAAIDNIKTANADLIFIRSDSPFMDPNFECITLDTEYMYALFNKNIVNSKDKTIHVKDLSPYGLLTTSPNTHVYECCKRIFSKYNLPLKVAFMTNSDNATFIDMVKRGIGTILMAESIAKAHESDEIVALKLKPTQYVYTYMIYPKNKKDDPFYKEIIQHILKTYEEKKAEKK